MTPWRAMILAPVFAALIIFVGVQAPQIVAALQAIPVLGPLFQKALNPNAAGTAIMIGILCPAIPAFLAVALYRVLLQMSRDWKAQRIRERRKGAWLARTRAITPTVEHLAQQKSGIDNRGKSI